MNEQKPKKVECEGCYRQEMDNYHCDACVHKEDCKNYAPRKMITVDEDVLHKLLRGMVVAVLKEEKYHAQLFEFHHKNEMCAQDNCVQQLIEQERRIVHMIAKSRLNNFYNIYWRLLRDSKLFDPKGTNVLIEGQFEREVRYNIDKVLAWEIMREEGIKVEATPYNYNKTNALITGPKLFGGGITWKDGDKE